MLLKLKIAFVMMLIWGMLALPSLAGDAVYFDADGNRISAEQYEAMNQAAQDKKAAQQEVLQKAKEARARELARERAARRKQEEEARAAAARKAPATPTSSAPEAVIDRMIQGGQTGASSVAPPTSALNTYKCYTYREMFAQAEDLYTEYISGKSVIKMVLMNGVWRKANPCGDDGFKVGKRLPHVKDVGWSWNKLNPNRKTGGYKGD